MRKVWVCCVKSKEDVDMKLEQGSSLSSSSSSSQLHIDSINTYDKNLQGIKKIAFVTDLTVICNWFLGFCALTWASAVLLGAYIDKLSMWNYYDVSLLLFVEGLRFGLSGFLRLLGYRLSDYTRWSLESIAFFLPVGMGGFAVVSILPANIHSDIHHSFLGQSTSPPPTSDGASAPPYGSPYDSLDPSLYIFYGLVLLNAFILLLGSSVAGLMRHRYVKSNVKSLCNYHDKILDSTTSWLRRTVDLDFAFQIQGSQYRKGRNAKYVCQNYTDLICYLYMHKGGVEAAEAALGAEDRYVREAAANIIGFWAILETVVVKPCPLCFQREMLSKLADIAAESYGSLGVAAARSFMLLLMSVELDLISVVANVRSKSAEKDLIEILLGRVAELLHPPYPPTYQLPRILQEKSHAHVYALREYVGRLQRSASESKDTFIGAQRAQLEKRIKEVLPEMVNVEGSNLIQSLNKQLSNLVLPHDDNKSDIKSTEAEDYIKNYESDIKGYLTGHPCQAASRSLIKATFLVLFNVAVPLVCLGVGFIVSALL